MQYLATSVLLTASLVAADCSNNLQPSSQVVAAKGWSYRVVANGFKRPRGIMFDNNDGLLVIDSGAGLVHLSLKDDGGTCVSVSDNKTLVDNEMVGS